MPTRAAPPRVSRTSAAESNGRTQNARGKRAAVERSLIARYASDLSPLVRMRSPLRSLLDALRPTDTEAAPRPWSRPWVARPHPAAPAPPDAQVRAMSPSEFEAFQLWTFGEAGIPAVRVVPGRGGALAPACREGAGRVLTLEGAMKHRPIPHDTAGGVACRCTYAPLRRIGPVRRHARR